MPNRLVVVGGGAAGMSAASAARRTDPELEIVVLESSGYAAYGLCGIPYYLAGLVDRAEDLLAYPATYFRDHRRLDLRHHATAVELDPHRHTLQYTQDGRTHRLGYSSLVVTTGGVPTVFPLPGVPADRVFTI